MHLGEQQIATLRAAVDRVVPADEVTGPGAIEAGVVDYILGQFDRDFAGLVDAYQTFLDSLDGEANARFGQAFTALTADRQDEILLACETDDARGAFFRRFVEHVQEGFYISPVAWKMIGWQVKG